MPKINFKDYICRPYCKFFREGEKEDMACEGALVIESMIESGRLTIDKIPSEKNPNLWTGHNNKIEFHVCSNCSFLIDGCDFMSKNPPENSVPCGGYILLSILLHKRIISSDDLGE